MSASTTTEKKARTMLDVNKDYQMGCLKAGQLQYQIVTLQKDLDILNSTLRDLNFEGAHLQAVTAEAEKLVAATAGQQQATNAENLQSVAAQQLAVQNPTHINTSKGSS